MVYNPQNQCIPCSIDLLVKNTQQGRKTDYFIINGLLRPIVLAMRQ
jgi:hypothetical protein